MTPTPEQAAIIEAAKTTKDSLLISALAGAAKTSTLEMICKALPSTLILSVCFNKRIAEEMVKRLPGNVTVKTLNSVGHSVWSTALGKRLTLNAKKSYEILKAEVETLKGAEKADAYDIFADVLKMVSAAKLSGYIPSGPHGGHGLVAREDFYDSFDETIPRGTSALVDRVLSLSIRQALEGTIDFDDQIYMPTLFGGSFPRFPLVLVDEAQDLSAINHQMLRKIATQRLIAVGDPWQSIYGFRGAVSSGMDRLQADFSLRRMDLSVSFRCPKAVVRTARSRAPHMQYPEWAIEGHVEALDAWSASSIPDHAAIICRNNAPLFRCALSLIRAGRGVKLIGADIGPQLVKALRKLGPESLTQTETFNAINQWEAEQLRKSKAKGAAADRAECLRVFASFGANLAGAIAYAEHLFQSSGPIQLLSGHKAKGLEWATVYHLDPWRIPNVYSTTSEELEQEENVRYVITTRAKEELYFVNLDQLTA